MLKEFRRHERRRLRGHIELSWTAPDGKISAITANCLDVSVYGMLIESPSPVPAGTTLRATLQGSDISGEAVVRHCRQYGPWFRIGLRFVGALLLPEIVPHIEEPLLKSLRK